MSRFLKTLTKASEDPPPIWLMRQAGRYLPEYRDVRKTAGSFLKLCYTPALASEVTLQPIRRYGFDAAILFSDILVVPDALGQPVRFVEGEGPRLDPITSQGDLGVLDPDATDDKFARVSETVARLKQDLPKDTALIGFCGAPWTVATYMVGGKGSPDQAAARTWAYRDPEGFQRLIDILVAASLDYLDQQVKAGANALQIFDSWAGSLPESEFERWVIAPTVKLRRELAKRHPDIPVIGFPRGAGAASLRYVEQTGVDGVSCDTAMPLSYMADTLAEAGVAVQGNLDPLLLVLGGQALNDGIDALLSAMHGKRFIFNLGHGIVPQTSPDHVAHLVDRVRQSGR